MKKIVFCGIPMKDQVDRACYKVSGNSTIEYDGVVAYPINGVLARTLARDDDVKVVLLKKTTGSSDRNLDWYKEELDRINADIGAKIKYKVLSSQFDESREVQEGQLRDMVGELIEGAHIYADITYGPKSMPIITFTALNFAEKFFKGEIRNIVYGKAEFDNDNKSKNHELFDMTALFYLNSIVSTIECKDGEMAKEILDTILLD